MRVENNCHSFFADTVDWWDIFLGDKAAGRYVHVAVQVRRGGVFSTRHVLINVSLLRGIFDSSILLFAFNHALFFVTSFWFFLGYILSNFIALLFSSLLLLFPPKCLFIFIYSLPPVPFIFAHCISLSVLFVRATVH